MFQDEELLPISALQHYIFCQRRAALVHIEGLWAENVFTAEGNQLHRRAHDSRQSESRSVVRMERGLELRSLQYGLIGKADVVEFFRDEAKLPLIIEYKRGKPSKHRNVEFRVQLCAQALCLEEMLEVSLPEAAIYFGKTKQRVLVPLDESLRKQTVESITNLHRMIQSQKTPSARFHKKCNRCSLKDLCLPKAINKRISPGDYLQQLISESDLL